MIAGLHPGRILILAPRGRDAVIAKTILTDGKFRSHICLEPGQLLAEIKHGAELIIYESSHVSGPSTAGHLYETALQLEITGGHR